MTENLTTMAGEEAPFDPVEYINIPRWRTVRPGLERISELMERLGNPHRQLKFVHVAGTNGKGSICAFVAKVLQAAGYRTGLFTSPYIETFEERIRVNGCLIPMPELTEVTLAVREQAEAMQDHPTEFELMCAVAMMHFARSGCDIVVAEVGLGGLLDATNIIENPEVSVLARIGLDHTALLGDTLTLIAGEKAGIIKPGCPVVSYPQDPEAAAVFAQVAAEKGCELMIADFRQLRIEPLALGAGELPLRSFTYRGKAYQTQLLGSYQAGNAATALDAIAVLQARGWDIPETAVQEGIAQTTWPGRFEVVNTQPLTIVDGGHNPQGASAMAETLTELLPGRKVTFIIGILADKDYPDMLECVVPYGNAFVTVTPANPRALDAAELAASILRIRPDAQVEVARDYEDAARIAYGLAGGEGVICAFGSLYSVSMVKRALKTQGNAIY